MKNKFLNLNILLLLFLCLIGFSPQCNGLFFDTVHATTVDSAVDLNNPDGTVGIVGDSFDNKLDTLLNPFDGNQTQIKNDILESLNLVTSTLTGISKVLGGFAIALSVLIITIIGFKVMNSGTGDVLSFMKKRKDISNALMCIVFILAIPYLVKSVLEFQPPKSIISSINPTATGTDNIGDIAYIPTSGMVETIKNIELDDTKYSIDIANQIKEENNKTGILGILWSALVSIFAAILYAPILLLTSLIGSIGFFPMSLDPNMYHPDTVAVLKNFFNLGASAGVVDLGTESLPAIASGLKLLTDILNILYFIVKKFSMICLEFVCYYYGIMKLLNKDSGDVFKFLKRMLEGVIGMLLFPTFLQFLLDVDGMISFALLRITGPNIPGLTLLNLMPKFSDASKGFTILILSICMGCLLLNVAKTFFVRRVEISLLYIMSPVYFLKHMMSTTNDNVGHLIKKITSATFLTVVYSPLFVIISLFIKLGNATEDSSVIYFILVLGILFSGKGIITNIFKEFAGNSNSSAHGMTSINKGLSEGQNKMNTLGKIAGTAAVASTVYGAGKLYTNKDAIAAKPKTLYNDFKNKGFKGVAKDSLSSFKSGVKSGAKSTLDFGKNKAKKAFWENYNNIDKKLDSKFGFGTAEKEALEAKSKYSQDSYGREDELERARAMDVIFDNSRPGFSPGEAKKQAEFYVTHKKIKLADSEFMDKSSRFLPNAKNMAEKSNNPHLKHAFAEYESVLDSTKELIQDRDKALAINDIGEAYKLHNEIQDNKVYLKRCEDSFQRAYQTNEAYKVRENGVETLGYIAKNPSVLAKPDFVLKEANVESSLSTLENHTDFKAHAATIQDIKTTFNSGDTEGAQAKVIKFLSEQKANPNISADGRNVLNNEINNLLAHKASSSIVNSVKIPKVPLKVNTGTAIQSVNELANIKSFSSNEAMLGELNTLIDYSKGSDVAKFNNAFSTFVATHANNPNLTVEERETFDAIVDKSFNINKDELKQIALRVQDASNEIGGDYAKAIEGIVSGKSNSTADYIALVSGNLKADFDKSVEMTNARNIEQAVNNTVKQHVKVVSNAVSPDDTTYKETLNNVLKQESIKVSDLMSISTGSNASSYTTAKNNIASTIIDSGSGAPIVSELRNILTDRQNTNPDATISIEEVAKIISANGGAKGLELSYNDAINGLKKMNETNKTQLINLPKKEAFNVTIRNSNNNSSKGNKSNGREDKTD